DSVAQARHATQRPRPPTSPARMMRRMHLFQALPCHMRVDLRGREITVSEQHLYDTQIGTMVQQVRGKCMSQCMRREFLSDPGLAGVALDDVPEGLARHPIAAACREQIVGLALEQNLATRALPEVLQPAHGFLAQRNQSLAITLAEDTNHALSRIHLAVAEVHQLRNTQPGGIQYFQHGAIAVTERI